MVATVKPSSVTYVSQTYFVFCLLLLCRSLFHNQMMMSWDPRNNINDVLTKNTSEVNGTENANKFMCMYHLNWNENTRG